MATAIDFLTLTDLKTDHLTKDNFRLIFQLENTTIPAIKIKDVAVQATVLGGRVIPVSETKQPRPLP